MDSDRHWIKLGRLDPYLQTVRTLDPYKLDPTLAGEADPYFASGARYVADLFSWFERLLGPGFKPRRAVDFGCSVGRIAIPLAKRCDEVIGLDVSAEALAEAHRNAERFAVSNVRWLASDDKLTSVKEQVDLFHSYNVLQHLPVRRGLGIVERALEVLAPGGVFGVHVPYADRASRVRRAVNWAQAHVPGVHALANIARGRSWDYPHMLMNAYDPVSLFSRLVEAGCEDPHCKFIDQGRYPGAIVIGRKRSRQARETGRS